MSSAERLGERRGLSPPETRRGYRPSRRAFPVGINPTARWCIVALVALTGCRQKMATQPAYRPLRASTFFRDGMTARPQVPGTIARGDLDGAGRGGKASWTPGQVAGLIGALALERLPFIAVESSAETSPRPLTKELLVRGQQRFDIYCSMCHDRTGGGDGMIVQRGYARPPSYHIDRLRKAPDSYIFDVITQGHGAMPDYAAQIPREDRWAIIAYVRALQRAGNATLADVSADERKKLEAQK
jgi:mono/diheme cytochrome c family protein